MAEDRYESLVRPKVRPLTIAKALSGKSTREIADLATANGATVSKSLAHLIFKGRVTKLSKAAAIAKVFGEPVYKLFEHVNGDPIGRIDA